MKFQIGDQVKFIDEDSLSRAISFSGGMKDFYLKTPGTVTDCDTYEDMYFVEYQSDIFIGGKNRHQIKGRRLEIYKNKPRGHRMTGIFRD